MSASEGPGYHPLHLEHSLADLIKYFCFPAQTVTQWHWLWMSPVNDEKRAADFFLLLIWVGHCSFLPLCKCLIGACSRIWFPGGDQYLTFKLRMSQCLTLAFTYILRQVTLDKIGPRGPILTKSWQLSTAGLQAELLIITTQHDTVTRYLFTQQQPVI